MVNPIRTRFQPGGGCANHDRSGVHTRFRTEDNGNVSPFDIGLSQLVYRTVNNLWLDRHFERRPFLH